MKERRKRLLRIQIKSTQAQSGQRKATDFTAEYQTVIQNKKGVLNTFDSAKLETILKDSTKNTALELVLTLVPSANKPGVLVDLELSHNVKADPQSPSYTNKNLIGQQDANGNTISQSEASLTIDNSEEGDLDDGKSPSIAYSDKKLGQSRANTMQQHGRTSTGFSTQSNLQTSKGLA